MVTTVFLGAWMVLAFAAGPVASDYALYQRVGQHAAQMQAWKKYTKSYMLSLRNLADGILADTLALNTSLQSAKREVDVQVAGLDVMSQKLMSQLTDISVNGSTLSELESPPAFQAFVVDAGTSPIAVNTITFKYGNVKLNEGSHYSPTTGLFTAPVTGLYWFHATFTSADGKREAVMKKRAGGQEEVIAYMNFYNNQETACTTVTLLHTGDTVGIYVMSSTFETWSLSGGVGNTFAGYLVAKYDDPNYVPPAAVPTTVGASTVAGTTTVAATTQTSGP